MMFINAKPRPVSTGFEAFVPTQVAESLHHRLVGMTNNEVNAWSIFTPMQSTNDNWAHQVNNFNGDENLSGHSPYGGYFQGSASVAGTQATCLPKTTSYTALRQDQRQPRKTPVSHEIYHEPTQDMKCVQRPSPMLGDPYFQCGAGQGRGSFAEFSSSRSGLKYLSYRTSIEPETVVFKASSQTPASYTGPSSTTNECASTKACYESTSDYGTLPSLYTSIDQQSMMPREDPIVVEDTMETAWWPGKTRNANDQYQTNDGLPKFSVTQQSQDYGDIWSGSAPATTWTPQDAAQATISPKMLTLDLSSAPMSSSGSSQGTVISYSGSSSTPSIAENVPEVSAPETSPVLKQPVPIRPRRQMVPEPLPSPRIPLPILPSNDFNSAQVPRRRSLRNASTNLAQMKSSNAYSSATANSKNDSRRSEVVPPKSKMPKKINPKPTTLPEEPSWASSNLSTAAVQAAHHRDAKDDFLVKSKLAGMSYRYIRRKGKFSEAESTLRGRFRTLTKHKTARVRKPEWNDNDVRLLKKGVRKLASSSDIKRDRIPWKAVAEYIANNGGSYHFGNATCRKRWDDLQDKSE